MIGAQASVSDAELAKTPAGAPADAETAPALMAVEPSPPLVAVEPQPPVMAVEPSPPLVAVEPQPPVMAVEPSPPLVTVEHQSPFFPASDPRALDDALDEALRRFTKDVYDFLSPIDQKTLLSGLAVLALVRRVGLQLPRFNVLMHPFLIVFEGFLRELFIVTGVVSMKRYEEKPYTEQLGSLFRDKDFQNCVEDQVRHGFIIEKLRMAWINIRCQELHSDPMRGDRIFELTTLAEMENKLGELATVMIESWRILVEGRGANGAAPVSASKQAQTPVNIFKAASSSLAPASKPQSEPEPKPAPFRDPHPQPKPEPKP